jgi:hypothetical protein
MSTETRFFIWMALVNWSICLLIQTYHWIENQKEVKPIVNKVALHCDLSVFSDDVDVRNCFSIYRKLNGEANG